MYETKNYTTDGELKAFTEDAFPLKGYSKGQKRKFVKKYIIFKSKYNNKIQLVFVRDTNFKGHKDNQKYRGIKELVDFCESEEFNV